MATKTGTKVTPTIIEKACDELNNRVTILEKLARKPKARKQREYTEEEKVAIRARLLAGQEAARKRRENKTKVKPEVKTAKDIKKVVSPVGGDSMKGNTVQ